MNIGSNRTFQKTKWQSRVIAKLLSSAPPSPMRALSCQYHPPPPPCPIPRSPVHTRGGPLCVPPARAVLVPSRVPHASGRAARPIHLAPVYSRRSRASLLCASQSIAIPVNSLRAPFPASHPQSNAALLSGKKCRHEAADRRERGDGYSTKPHATAQRRFARSRRQPPVSHQLSH